MPLLKSIDELRTGGKAGHDWMNKCVSELDLYAIADHYTIITYVWEHFCLCRRGQINTGAVQSTELEYACPTTWERYGWSHSYAEQTFIVMSKCKRSGRNACRPASWIAKETVKILIRHQKTNFSHRDMAGLNKKSNQQNPISSGNKSCEPADRNICAFVNSNSALGVKQFKSQQR